MTQFKQSEVDKLIGYTFKKWHLISENLKLNCINVNNMMKQ